MIRRVGAFLLTFFVMSTVATLTQAQSQSLSTRHTRDAVVTGESQFLGRLPATQTMKLTLMLPLRHQPELEDFLKELSDPASSSYRHFLSIDEFTARYGPSREDYGAVIRFARTNGFKLIAPPARNRMIVQVSGPVSAVEKAFHLEMGLYQHPNEDRKFFAPDREPTADLPFQLWHISGLDNFSIPRPKLQPLPLDVHQNAVQGSCPNHSYCGSDMRGAYYQSGALTGAGQWVGLFEFAGTDLDDLNTYYANAHQTLNVPITLLSVDGTPTSCLASQGCDDTEQTIDLQQALGMAPNLAGLVVFIGSDDTAIFNSMATTTPLNAQIGCSWGWSPADSKADDPIFQEMSAQGQNVFVAAGDSGEWRGGIVYPSDDAYIVSVGGTDLQTQGAGGPWLSETAWSDGGGGVSTDRFPIPYWQVATAATCPACSQVLRNGPDVSAESNFDFYYCSDQSGCGTGLGGTSFAAPMWAGYLALVNQQIVANGNAPLGFINPEIYSIGLSSAFAADFHDITQGSNGLSATVGYDLATGWGSPNTGLINSLSGPFFTLTPSPFQLTVPQTGSGNSTITIAPSNGFNGPVTLAASGLPSGVTATFSPNPATTTSTLTFTASGAAVGVSNVLVTGTSGSLSTETGIQLTVGGAPGASLSPSILSFGNVVVGSTSPVKSVTLSNPGAATLTINSITTTGDFAVSSTTCGATLAQGKNCKINLTFTPSALGSRTGSLKVSDNAVGSPQSASLSGTGTAAATLTPTSASFPKTKVGAQSAAKTFTLTNKQKVSLTGISAATTGNFNITGTTCGSSLAAKAKCTFSVVFVPTKIGVQTGTLQVSDDAAGSPQTSTLSGTGK